MFLFLPLGLVAGGLARGVLAHAPLPDGAVLALSLLAMLAVGLSMGRYGVLYATPVALAALVGALVAHGLEPGPFVEGPGDHLRSVFLTHLVVYGLPVWAGGLLVGWRAYRHSYPGP